MSEIVLENWSYREYDTSEWHKGVSGPLHEIHVDLLHNKAIPDPFIDMNEKDVQWVGEREWEYQSTFTLPKELADKKKHDILFEGLDTFATVYLNDVEILKADNYFVIFRSEDIGKHLKYGEENTLRIKFDLALNVGREIEAKSNKKYGCFNGEASRLYIRKAQYHYGWDWGPVLLTCGIHEPIKLLSYDARIEDVYVNQHVDEKLNATFDIEVELSDAVKEAKFEVKYPDGSVHTETATPSGNKVSVKVSTAKENLWYPLGQGEQKLHEISVEIPGHKWSKKVGIRRIELVQETFKEQEGSSFYFRVNNIPIYSTGSNWIPGHSFKTALTRQDYTDWLQLMVDGYQNMIRVWGGGYYETDFFYEECDRLGILVWQDFMFACGQYPGDAAFIANVSKEIETQLKRLRNYASLALYAGNNEDYQVAEEFSLDWDKDDLSGDYSKTNFPARTLYETTFPKLVAKLNPQVPYHPGSPWGGKASYDPTIGDIHQWNVWHGKQEKYQDWYKLGGRFISEFGMEALPNKKTYEQCITDKTELYPQSETVDHHNKAEGFERRLALYVFENIKVEGLTLDGWIYATQLMQAECLGYAYRCWRREWRGDGKRYTGGAIVWQINDCWPVASWALIDFYKRPKLAYYSVKRESRAIGLGMYRNEIKHSPYQKTEDRPTELPHDYSKVDYKVDVWGVNGTVKDVNATLKVDVYHVTSGEKVDSLPDQKVVLAANGTSEFVKDFEIDNEKPVVVYSRFVDDNGEIIASAADWPQPLKYLKFPNRKVDFKVHDGRIELTTNLPVKGVEIIVERDVFLQDNGFDIFPGDTKVVIAADLKTTDKVTVRWYQQ